MEKDDDLALQQFYSTLTKKESCYYVGWPFKTGISDLADDYGLCYLRLESIIKRLKDNRELLLKYDGIFKKQESKGIIEEILPEKETLLVHYLPPSYNSSEDVNQSAHSLRRFIKG